jgi:predicted nucleotidyltransferase
MIFFQADPHSPIFKDLQSLLTKTAGLVDVLREVLAPLADRIICCFVYGSIARREERSASDVDLMIIGDVSLALVADALRPAREKLAREVNPRLYRPDEFAKRLAANDHFLTSVLKKPKLFVIGSPDALEQTAKRRPRGPRANQPDRAGQTALDRAAVLQ